VGEKEKGRGGKRERREEKRGVEVESSRERENPLIPPTPALSKPAIPIRRKHASELVASAATPHSGWGASLRPLRSRAGGRDPAAGPRGRRELGLC
jgi:hypothetical protein